MNLAYPGSQHIFDVSLELLPLTLAAQTQLPAVSRVPYGHAWS